MNITIAPGPRTGSIRVPASKSQAHRLLICAALGTHPVRLRLDGRSRDIDATAGCLRALGAEIKVQDDALTVSPIRAVPQAPCHLFCGESGSTLRFLLPVCGALGAQAVFHMEGRLPERPLAPLDRQLLAHGMTLRQEGALLYASGRLTGGAFSLPGSVSSQFVSGLLMALPRVEGESLLTLTDALQSAGYVDMTLDALRLSGVSAEKTPEAFRIPGGQTFSLPEACAVEGDWSSAAFFLCAGAFSARGIRVCGLRADSSQGDRAVLALLRRFGAQVEAHEDGVLVRHGTLRGIRIDAAQIPDLVPALAVTAAGAVGTTVIENAARLRLKESDRLQTTAALLRALGAAVTELPDGLVIEGRGRLSGGTVSAYGDHRIAMSAALAAALAESPVTVTGAESVEKSYPRFWNDLRSLSLSKKSF